MFRRTFMALALLAACVPQVVGQAPDGWDTFVPVPFEGGTIHVTRDYYHRDGIRMPVGLTEAYEVADSYDARLPSPAMVDAIWRAADAQLRPQFMTPDGTMTTLPVFREHHRLIEEQLAGRTGLIAGHKKDIVEAGRSNSRVAIYGWHYPNGSVVQPYNNRSHGREYRDYSHGLRLVRT